MNHSEMRKLKISLFFSKIQIWVLGVKKFLVDILPLGSGSVDPHVFADLDPGSQNLTDPNPKSCSKSYLTLDTHKNIL